MAKSKRFVENEDGSFVCTACKSGPYKSMSSAQSHWYRNHKKGAKKKPTLKARAKKAAAMSKLERKAYETLTDEHQLALEKKRKAKSYDAAREDKMYSNEVKLKYCPHCGGRMPVSMNFEG